MPGTATPAASALHRYLKDDVVRVWLAQPSHGGVYAGQGGIKRLAEVVLEQLDVYVDEMEGYLAAGDGGAARRAAAQELVEAHVDEQVRAQAQNGSAVTRAAVAAQYTADLTAEHGEIEGQLAHRLAKLVEREVAATTATPHEALVLLLDRRVRALVHRLVELPLWRAAAEACARGR